MSAIRTACFVSFRCFVCLFNPALSSSAAIEYPRAKHLSEKDHWNLTLLDEMQQLGWLDKLYKH